MDIGYGGAVDAEFESTTTVSDSTFKQNQAIGGNNGNATGTDIVEVGDGEGGAFCSQFGAVASVSACTFQGNQALGGDGNTGSGTVVNVGAALGGGINSSWGGVDIGANTLTVNNCVTIQNDATGGNSNSGTASVAALSAPGSAPVLRITWEEQPPSAAARWAGTKPAAATRTHPAARGRSSSIWARGRHL